MIGGFLLVAEDDATDAFMLERAVKKSALGWRVHRVASGDELIQYLKGAGRYSDRAAFPVPDVVLLDLKMPGTDGFGVLQWRLTEALAATLPVVVFTSSALSQDVEAAYRLGASSYVVKPSHPGRLHDFVRALTAWWCQFNALPGRVHSA
jgi:CheY-like chemotaxis protein